MAELSTYRGDRKQQGINVRELVYVVFRRRLVIVAVMLPIVVVASLGLFQGTGSTIAACKILIELQSPEAPRWDTRRPVDYDRTLSTLIYMAMSAPVARLAAESLQDSLDVIVRLEDGAFARLADREQLAEFIFQRLDVHPIGESSILNLRFRSRNPRLALMAVDACREAFMKYAITAPKNVHALEYYDDQVRLVRSELDKLLQARAQIVAQAGYGAVEFDMRAISQQLVDMRNTYIRNRIERSSVDSRVASLRKAQTRDPRFVPSPDRPGTGVAMLNAKNQVEQLRSQETDMLTRYTEDHIEVRRVRERLEWARATLAREVDDYIHAYELEADALRARDLEMQAQLRDLEQAMEAVPELSRHVSLYNTEIDGKTRLLRDLQIKRGEVLINIGADERIASIIRLTDPEIETVITEARKFVYFGMIVFFGLVFALTVAVVVDGRDHRLHTPEQVKSQLGVPVLASVSEEASRRTGS